MTKHQIIAERIILETRMAEGEEARKALRLLQDGCGCPEEEKTTTTKYGWSTDTCGICHKHCTYSVSEEAMVGQL